MVKFISEFRFNEMQFAWAEKKTKYSFADNLIDELEEYIYRGYSGNFGSLTELLNVVDGVFRNPVGSDIGNYNVMTYENALCTIRINGNKTKRPVELKRLYLPSPMPMRVEGLCNTERLVDVKLDEGDLHYLDNVVDGFLREEAAFLAAEKRFAARNPLVAINGMTPEQALMFIKALRQETL